MKRDMFKETHMYFRAKYKSRKDAKKELGEHVIPPYDYRAGQVYAVDHCAPGPVIQGTAHDSRLFVRATFDDWLSAV